MIQFHNRSPWNLILGFGFVAGIIVTLAINVSWWCIGIPLAYILASCVWSWVSRLYGLSVNGYHRRRVRGSLLLYEERSGSSLRSFVLNLENTEHGHYELFVPSQLEWQKFVPEWAQTRRTEIVERIAKSWVRKDVHVD